MKKIFLLMTVALPTLFAQAGGRGGPPRPPACAKSVGSATVISRKIFFMMAPYLLPAVRLLYAASTNMSVVQKPVAEPKRGSQSRVGLESFTCASDIPFLMSS